MPGLIDNNSNIDIRFRQIGLKRIRPVPQHCHLNLLHPTASTTTYDDKTDLISHLLRAFSIMILILTNIASRLFSDSSVGATLLSK